MKFNLDGLTVYFPYDRVYPEQYQYMLELKRALDARGDAILEMPTGTGKTVSLLALITSYQLARPDCGKLIYCTRTVPEMEKTIEELKRVIAHRTELLGAGGDILAVCLSSRRNLCIHPDVSAESDKERVDAACRSMTASWVRTKAESDPTVKTCRFFEGWDRNASDAEIRGLYDMQDLKALGRAKGWCPYFAARHVISYANVVVYNYQYMLDPKIAALVSRELEDKSIVVFDEAHNIDNVCIEALSVSLDRRTLDAAAGNLSRLGNEVKTMKQADAGKLQAEYASLVAGLGGGVGAPSSSSSSSSSAAAARRRDNVGAGGGEELPGPPILPADVLQEAVPGNIRNAELFVRFMKHVVRYMREKIKVAAVLSETPTRFLHDMGTALSVDIRPLRFAYSRLNSLLRALQVTGVDEFGPLNLVADFATLLATYPVGFMVITEPYAAKTPHIPDPVMQLVCLDASLAIKPVFDKFQSVILTSGTLSPLDMYPKMLNFHPVVRASLEMSIVRPCICPMVVGRGGDQTPLTTKFEQRDTPAVVRNYGMLLVSLANVVPDGIVAFFPSYSYMETIVSAWHASGVLRQLEANKLLFIETKDVVETTMSLTNYKKACDTGRGAVFLSVARGKVAEGIDFDRHYGRAVVVIGIPFQYTLSHVLRARLVYLRDVFGIREQDFLTFDAVRQAAQCVGRIIRSKRDYGIIVFADKRYASHDKRSKLPQWVLQFLPDAHINLTTDMAVHIARKFLKEMAQPVKGDQGTLLTAEDIEAMSASTSSSSVGPERGRPAGYPAASPPSSSSPPGAAAAVAATSRAASLSSALDESAIAEAMEMSAQDMQAVQQVEREYAARTAAEARRLLGPRVVAAAAAAQDDPLGIAGFASGLLSAGAAAFSRGGGAQASAAAAAAVARVTGGAVEAMAGPGFLVDALQPSRARGMPREDAAAAELMYSSFSAGASSSAAAGLSNAQQLRYDTQDVVLIPQGGPSLAEGESAAAGAAKKRRLRGAPPDEIIE